MTSEEMLEKARFLARTAHAGQVDKAGADYYLHVQHVADHVDSCLEKTVAYLHDIVEDTDWTLEKLTEEGFPREVTEAVDAMSRRDGESYNAYLRRASRNAVARRVKMADLKHNAELGRYPHPTEEDCRRCAGYVSNIRIFEAYCRSEEE